MNLSEDQKEALTKINKFLKDRSIAFTLIGNAGSGKTAMICETYQNYGMEIIFCAPTNKAASVLIDSIKDKNVRVITIHKLLELQPNLDIVDFDCRNLKFKRKDTNFINKSLIICDEASMINDDLYEVLIKECIIHKCKIIFLIDDAQLQPVNSKSISKVALIDNKYKLTTNHRQSNLQLYEFISKSRSMVVNDFKEFSNDDGFIKIFKSAKEMINEASIDFKVSISLNDITHCKVLTYTNERVKLFNRHLHKMIFDSDLEFCPMEILTCYSNNLSFVNGMDYKIKDVNKLNDYLYEVKFTNNFICNIYSNSTPDEIRVKLANALEQLRLEGLAKKSNWSNYYSYLEGFHTTFDLVFEDRVIKGKDFDYGYSISIHKSQGSTYNNVYLDNNSLQFCRNISECRQLQYVGMSRTQYGLNILL
jgi:ATP-dependent exoDNAse (exonuclease V) alpha subunit